MHATAKTGSDITSDNNYIIMYQVHHMYNIHITIITCLNQRMVMKTSTIPSSSNTFIKHLIAEFKRDVSYYTTVSLSSSGVRILVL